jgi:hypothetical protein
MRERETKKVYYETDVITKVICDSCGEDITNEQFFTIDISYREKDEEGKYISKVYDVNDCHVDICDKCIDKITKISTEVFEYVKDQYPF